MENKDGMVRNKAALFSSFVLLCICMYLFFPFPNNLIREGSTTFMSFPIRNQNGYMLLGIVGSVLFVVALILLLNGMKKYQFRALFLVVLVYTFLPNLLITTYQETLASGIQAISYDGNGQCNFESIDQEMNGECHLVLHNRSNEAVSFEVEFIDSVFWEDDVRVTSLMNLAGPYRFTIEANQKESIHLKELLDLSGVPKHIDSGESFGIHFNITENDQTRAL